VEHKESGVELPEPGAPIGSGTVEQEELETASSATIIRGSRETSFLNPEGEGIYIFQVKSSSSTSITAL